MVLHCRSATTAENLDTKVASSVTIMIGEVDFDKEFSFKLKGGSTLADLLLSFCGWLEEENQRALGSTEKNEIIPEVDFRECIERLDLRRRRSGSMLREASQLMVGIWRLQS